MNECIIVPEVLGYNLNFIYLFFFCSAAGSFSDFPVHFFYLSSILSLKHHFQQQLL